MKYSILVFFLLLTACTAPMSILESAVEAGCKLQTYEVSKHGTKVTCEGK